MRLNHNGEGADEEERQPSVLNINIGFLVFVQLAHNP